MIIPYEQWTLQAVVFSSLAQTLITNTKLPLPTFDRPLPRKFTRWVDLIVPRVTDRHLTLLRLGSSHMRRPIANHMLFWPFSALGSIMIRRPRETQNWWWNDVGTTLKTSGLFRHTRSIKPNQQWGLHPDLEFPNKSPESISSAALFKGRALIVIEVNYILITYSLRWIIYAWR